MREGTQTPMRSHTKVVATIGPASEDRLSELIAAGMSVARINFSHGNQEDHRRRVERVRAAAALRGHPVGILADIQGPKLRLGLFPEGKMELSPGDRVRLVETDGLVEDGLVPLGTDGLSSALEPGHRVFLADGVVELIVESQDGEAFIARTRRGGLIGDRKGVHLPDTIGLNLQVPTPQDRIDLEFAREIGVDMVGLSFVSSAEQIREAKRIVGDVLMVAKIERARAVENLDEILAETDGIMVARGDLGVEVPLEELPILQKTLLQAALRAGKFTITATEMLESMVDASRPTRAEVADVANAVLDGTDAVMLSAETAVGRHPVEAVATMNRIARAVETSHRYAELPRVGFRTSEPTFSNAVALAAAEAAEALQLAKIICFTETGNTVRLISRYRPTAEIFALTPHRRTLSHMTVLAHVRPLEATPVDNLEDMLERASRMLLQRELVELGEEVIFVAGVPPAVARSTNVMKLHRIGDPVKLA